METTNESGGRGRRGDLRIDKEDVMLELPRGDELFRVTFTEATTADGKKVAWHSLRVFWKDASGEWCPGKQGITIRGKELSAVADALNRAVSGR